jgi:predicted transglutaminase-like cysteine proteinase
MILWRGRRSGRLGRFGWAAVVAMGLAVAPSSIIAGIIQPGSAGRHVGSEPFGMTSAAVPAAALQQKWQAVARQIEAEDEIIALCLEDRGRCGSASTRRLVQIVDSAAGLDGKTRLGVINRAINAALRPSRDSAEAGDVWSSPLETLGRGAGDCEDYAIAKLVALRLAGVDVDDLRLTLVHDQRRNEDHAVAAAWLDDRWLILDNRRLMMIEDRDMPDVRPAVSIDPAGVWRK